MRNETVEIEQHTTRTFVNKKDKGNDQIGECAETAIDPTSAGAASIMLASAISVGW